jgi:lipopolysaccharide transport system permease protein
MGIAWNIIHPLAIITIYSLVFTRWFGSSERPGEGKLEYTIYLCAGFFPWLAFSDCVTRGCGAFINNATYLKKIPIPEQVFTAQTAASSTLNLAINFLLLLGFAMALGWQPGWAWLLLPIPLLLLQLLGFGLGLLLGTLNVFFRDIAEWVDVSLKLVMWTVPIVYKLDSQSSEMLREMLRWHPLMPVLESVRMLFMQRSLPSMHDWIMMTAWPVAVTAVAFAVLAKLRPEIRDLI